MDFKQINYDGDLDDLDTDELVGVVEQFEKAQETNVAEFNATKEQLREQLGDDAEFEDILGEVEDFAEAKDALIKETTEFESFEDSPMSGADLEAMSFGAVRNWYAHFSEQVEDDDDADDFDEESEFGDMGGRTPTHNEEDEDAEFAKRHLGGMAGF